MQVKTCLLQQFIQDGNPTQRVLHISDFHIDQQYTPGASAECMDKALCCSATSGNLLNNAW